MSEVLNPSGELPVVRWCRTDNAPALHTCYDAGHEIAPWSHRTPAARPADVLALLDLEDGAGNKWTAAIAFIGPVRAGNGQTIDPNRLLVNQNRLKLTGIRVVVE